ncbi:DUF1007 family protein [Epibacterium ulvae]|uniref:DUF1007 family protein n=1 Tax=Epibacterium ulvae TaxID=1156985 RepID=UPI002490A548|nr:DUF1007 family protein [Epibacterium ulvae]
MKRAFSALFTALPFACITGLAQAHPHVFVDTGFILHLDEANQITGIEVTWAYDDFYSLLIFEDMLLDSDFDGALTDAELNQLQGFDLNWDEDFLGDVYLSDQETPIPLGRPEHRATVVKDGRIATRHYRALSAPIPAAHAKLQAYDPTYYTAYTASLGVKFVGGTCAASVTPPNLDQAYTLVEELLYSLPTDQAEEAYPEVGQSFADTIKITCPAT